MQNNIMIKAGLIIISVLLICKTQFFGQEKLYLRFIPTFASKEDTLRPEFLNSFPCIEIMTDTLTKSDIKEIKKENNYDKNCIYPIEVFSEKSNFKVISYSFDATIKSNLPWYDTSNCLNSEMINLINRCSELSIYIMDVKVQENYSKKIYNAYGFKKVISSKSNEEKLREYKIRTYSKKYKEICAVNNNSSHLSRLRCVGADYSFVLFSH